ncbi:VOC family protein [Colwellia sp. MEBiC06753]
MPNASAQPALSAIKQIAIATNNIDAAKHFYCNVLGLPLLFDVPPNLVFVELAGIRLMITTLQGKTDDHHTSVIYYQTNDIEQYFDYLNQQNIDIERPPQLAAKMPDHELWIGFIRDPDDNLIGIMEEKPYLPLFNNNSSKQLFK